MVYITGDRHGNFSDLEYFCEKTNTTKNDILIMLGDVGLNYCMDANDIYLKKKVSSLPITIFCIQGNHEKRTDDLNWYKQKIYNGGYVRYEEEFPNILFAIDSEMYKFNEYSCMVIGGAYSVDKYYRLSRGLKWFDDEQPSTLTKLIVENKLKLNPNVDVFLTHTCPYKYMPTEAFIDGINQSMVDNSTELFLDKVENIANYKKWYCGHYHIEKKIDKVQFMYHNIEELSI